MELKEDNPSRPWTDEGVFRTAPGVYRISLPLPNDYLHAVNVYAIEDSKGLTLVDPGVAEPESRQRLEAALDILDCGLPDVTRCLVTHIHYDHYSQAVSLQREIGTAVMLGRDEKSSVAALVDPSWRAFRAQFSLLRRYGAPDVVDAVVATDNDSQPTVGFPDEWIDDGVNVEIGGRNLLAIHTPGHTRGHVVFVDSEDNLMFAGDHVLPEITPSIGFEPVPPPLPLGDYLRSLGKVRAMPDCRLLPAHGPVTQSAHDRIDELLAHHDRRLEAASSCVSQGAKTAAGVARRLTWTRGERKFNELSPFNQMLAVLETGAHLDLLVTRRRLSSVTMEGTLQYSADVA